MAEQSEAPRGAIPHTRVIIDKDNDGRRRYRWVVEFIVDEVWVEDGFDLTDDKAHDLLGNWLSYAYGYEFDARVVAAPAPRAIRKAQGFTDEPARGEAVRQ